MDYQGSRSGKTSHSKDSVYKNKLGNGLNNNVKIELEDNNKENFGHNNGKLPSMTVFDTKTIQKLAQYDLMKSERDFYFNK